MQPASHDERGLRTAALALAISWIAAATVFSVWPEIDLAVSSLFFAGGIGFPAGDDPTLQYLRWAGWRLSEGIVLLSVIGLAAGAARRAIAGIDPRRWAFVILLYAAGPGLIVDGILKRFSGRARPDDVTAFGGDALFTPALEIAHQCARNCSYVSGEGASAVAFAVSVAVLLSDPSLRIPPRIRAALIVVAVAVACAVSGLRIAMGRHFLSDTVFAALVVLTLAIAFWPVCQRLRWPSFAPALTGR
jgi:lipid A 4'-phosphatase